MLDVVILGRLSEKKTKKKTGKINAESCAINTQLLALSGLSTNFARVSYNFATIWEAEKFTYSTW
jgi:hypothetical protein